MHVGALVRQWVLERLSEEVMENEQQNAISQKDLKLTVAQLQNDLEHMGKHISALKKCVS